MSETKTYSAEAERQRLIRLIHVAKNDLKIQDDDYRAILVSVSGGKDSSAAMTIVELEKVVSHLKKCGFKVRTKAKPRPATPKSSRSLAGDPESKKIRALWLFLYELGAVKNPSEAALAAYVKRITGVDDLHWVRGVKVETLIETMKKWAMRYLPNAVQELAQQVQSLSLTDEEATSLNYWRGLARTRGTYDPMQSYWQTMTDVLAKG